MKVGRKLTIALVIVGTTIVGLSGCTNALTATPGHSISDGADGPKPTQKTGASTAIDIKGIGSQTIAVPVPSSRPAYFDSAFTCDAGSFNVVLQEDTRVYENGNRCPGDFGFYEMPIPGVPVLHFTITVDANSTFEFKGDFE